MEAPMEDRISSLESLTQMSMTMLRIMNEHMDAMDERQRQAEEWQRRAEEQQRLAEERQRERDELLQQMLQAVAVMQADIVRIDETHS